MSGDDCHFVQIPPRGTGGQERIQRTSMSYRSLMRKMSVKAVAMMHKVPMRESVTRCRRTSAWKARIWSCSRVLDGILENA